MSVESKQWKKAAALMLTATCAVSIVCGCQTARSSPPPAISAIQSFESLVSERQFEQLYDQAAHSRIKASTTRQEFVARMESGFGETFRKLCVEILGAYESGGVLNGRLYIGPMKYPIVTDTIVVELIDRAPVSSDRVIQPGNAMRIELAPEDGVLRFYDID